MKNRLALIAPSVFLLSLALAFAYACAGVQRERLGSVSLALNLHSSIAARGAIRGVARAIVPAEDWTPSAFSISGLGPGDVAFSAAAGNGKFETKLVQGNWTMTARAFSASGKEVASGSVSCALRPGKTTSAAILLCPLEGKGDLSLDIQPSLTPAEGSRVTGSLDYKGLPGRKNSASQKALSIDIPAGQGNISFPDIAAGQYSLSLRLVDPDGRVAGGCANTVVVMSGFLSSGVCAIELGSPIADLSASLVPASPLEPPLLSVAHVFSDECSPVPLALSRQDPGSGETLRRTWYANGVESGPALRLAGNRGILPEGVYAFPPGAAGELASIARFDLLEEDLEAARAGSGAVSLAAGQANGAGGFGWRARYGCSAALCPSLFETTGAANAGTGLPAKARAVAASPCGLVVVSGLDDEYAIHAFAAGYGASLEPAPPSGPAALGADASWLRLWRDRIKIGDSYKSADRLAASPDGRFIAAASSASNWLKVYSLDEHGKISASWTLTAEDKADPQPAFQSIRGLCFSADGRRLYAAANSSGTVFALDVGDSGVAIASSLKLSVQAEQEALSLRDLKLTSSGGIVVTASERSRIYVLKDDGALSESEVLQGASGGYTPTSPSSLAVSGYGDSFYVLCDGKKILRYARPDALSPFAATMSLALPPEAQGSSLIAAGVMPGDAEETVFAAGDVNVEAFRLRADGIVLSSTPLLSALDGSFGNPGAEGLCFVRGAFLLAEGGGCSVAVFGADP